MFPLGGVQGAQGPLMFIWDPPNISETTTDGKLKIKTHLDVVKYSLWVQKNFPPGGTGPPNVNLGPPNISETTRARKLNLKILLDMVKYPFRHISGVDYG